jgi:hypothetical protein
LGVLIPLKAIPCCFFVNLPILSAKLNIYPCNRTFNL